MILFDLSSSNVIPACKFEAISSAVWLFNCDICAESRMLVAASSELSLDCIRSAVKLPKSSIPNPNTRTAKAITSNGHRFGFIFLAHKTSVRRLFLPNMFTTHMRHFISELNFTSSSAPSKITPATTIIAPITASIEKKLSQTESEAVIQTCYRRIEVAQLVTGVALIVFSLILLIKFFIK